MRDAVDRWRADPVAFITDVLRDPETGEPFVVIDNVALGQGREPDGPLAVTLELSTFYRVGGDGT